MKKTDNIDDNNDNDGDDNNDKEYQTDNCGVTSNNKTFTYSL
jgi:hypothetical protein